MLARLGHYEEANAALNDLQPSLDQLSHDNKYKVIWSAWSQLIRAQMALSSRRFPETQIHCREALSLIALSRERLKSADLAVNTEVAIKATLGLSEVLSGDAVSGLRHSSEAAKVSAAASQRPTDDADIRLMLAEALLEGGIEKDALVVAQQAQADLSARHQNELEWRAWSIVARAQERRGQTEAMRAALSRTQQSLDHLRQIWGSAFDSYSSRLDIQRERKLLESLAAK
jgi:hypothetical protein